MVHWVKNWLKGKAQNVVVNGARFGWWPGISGVSPGCNSRASLFKVCISDLDAEVECMVSKSVEDSKLGGVVDSFRGQEALYRDLDKLENWVIIHGMQFNKCKCWVLHLGCSHSSHKSTLGEEWLQRRIWGCWLTGGSTGISSVCPGSQYGKAQPGVHQTKHHQPDKTSDYPGVFNTSVASP
ncbi:hypothetical protein DUI87_18596 [Hirundo rustica rustica]|uniref:Reverse transcriptase domain-containing protein n=1 Tax=Hirundo rustica rustica TaxID=333673 RepID=A0A3M0JX93_HIRRU|nr:hypothetical protein DUI87_18596 [Hirundo rustica rustica]